MQILSSRLLAVAVILGGIVLMWIAIASTNGAADQVADPFGSHVTKQTMRYLIVAIGALFSGAIMLTFGFRDGAERS